MSSETAKLVLQGGALAVLTLMLVGIFVLIRTGIPVIRDFLVGLLGILKADVGSLISEVKELRAAVEAEVKGLRASLESEMRTIRAELGLRDKIDELGSRIDEATSRPGGPESARGKDRR